MTSEANFARATADPPDAQPRARDAFSKDRPKGRAARAAPWALGLMCAALVLGGFVLGVRMPNLDNGLIAATFTAIGLFVVVRRPGNREGWLFVATGLAHAVMSFGRQYGLRRNDENHVDRQTQPAGAPSRRDESHGPDRLGPLRRRRAGGARLGGARIVVDFAVEPGGFVFPAASMFTTIAPSTSRFGRGALAAGEQVTVDPGTRHRWWNAGEGEVQARVRVEPALSVQQMILVAWGLCADGHTNAKGYPSPLFGALVASRYRREIRFRQPPAAVQRLLFPPLAAYARRRGLESTVDRYLDPESHPCAESGARAPPGAGDVAPPTGGGNARTLTHARRNLPLCNMHS